MFRTVWFYIPHRTPQPPSHRILPLTHSPPVLHPPTITTQRASLDEAALRIQEDAAAAATREQQWRETKEAMEAEVPRWCGSDRFIT